MLEGAHRIVRGVATLRYRSGEARMKRLVLAAALAAIAVAAAPASGITFGEPDGDGHPTVGALIVKLDDGALFPICSGTMVSSNVFLTAGHCTFLPDVIFGPGNYELGATFEPDLTGLTASDVTFGVAHTHPSFFPNAGTASKKHVDLGLLDLAGDPGVGWSALPEEGLLDEIDLREASFTTVGYGAVRETKKTGPHAILDNVLRRVATQSASHLNDSWLKLNMNPATGNGGTCYGDSGGPHFLEDSDVVVSVTSWGDAPCRSTDWTARVDTEAALDFVADFTE
jgi:Trypsin